MLLLQISELFFFIVSFFHIVSCEVNEFRIVQGRKASPEEFPYHAELVKYNQHWCGGAIIHKYFVITAAHCVKDFERVSRISSYDLHVRVGNKIASRDGVVHKIRAVYPHKRYVDGANTDTADIALVKLEKGFYFTSTVKMVKLGKRKPAVGELCWVIGFGKQKIMRYEDKSRHLMAVELPIIETSRCKSILSNVAKDMICAGYSSGHKDACVGDSGGPMVSNDALVGIVAWGVGCGRSGIPGVYTSVALYIPWIQKQISIH